MSAANATIELSSTKTDIILSGDWIIGALSTVEKSIRQLNITDPIHTIDATHIHSLDTAGAYLLLTLQKKINAEHPLAKLSGLKKNFHDLFSFVTNEINMEKPMPVVYQHHDFLYVTGKSMVSLYTQVMSMITFLGEVLTNAWFILLKPMKMQWKSIVYEIDMGGYRALPIIALMMFLIGIVVAYQLGVQLKIYGASIYMVDLSGVAILREFSPLICSVIIAGRTSTSFAALIGTMKVNEEIDALRVLGLSPVERLVLPKVIALLIVLPLLVLWGDIFGVLGSLLMTKSMMGIGTTAFLARFKQEVAVKHLFLGLIKTPVFAVIIAGIGCYQEFRAEGSAQSVGERTTKAAVQAIFLIILADGLFSILFNWMDLRWKCRYLKTLSTFAT